MYFETDYIYHIYNRGNNRQKIFFKEENYDFFLKKVKKELLPYCEILAYCLMPNHFHFLVVAKEEGCYLSDDSKSSDKYDSKSSDKFLQPLSRKIGTLLSSYTRAINIQENRIGSLFQQKAKAKCLTHQMTSSRLMSRDYAQTCFHYIHQNPLVAGLVDKMEHWPYSSFEEYCRKRNGSICNITLAKELVNFILKISIINHIM